MRLTKLTAALLGELRSGVEVNAYDFHKRTGHRYESVRGALNRLYNNGVLGRRRLGTHRTKFVYYLLGDDEL